MHVNIHQAKTHLSRLIEQVSRGETIIISKAGKPVAKLTAIDSLLLPRQPGSMKGRIRIAPDFDDPLPESMLRAFECGDETNS